MVRIKLGLAIACALALSVFVPRAKAGSVDFSCGAPAANACSGTITTGGSLAFASTGIGVMSSFDGTDTFNIQFSTNSSGTGTISIRDNNNDWISGNIVATSSSSFAGDETLVLNVNWTGMSSSVETALGSAAGMGQSTVIFHMTSGSVESADFHVGSAPPVPEPSTLLLLGTGLMGVGLAFRRFNS